MSSASSNNFDFIRLAAALSVVFSHQFALTGRPEPGFMGLHSLGGMGVVVFFIVSGYLVAQSWHNDPHVPRFAARRLLRLWPGLAVAVLLTAFVLGPLLSFLPADQYYRHGSVRHYLSNLWFKINGYLPIKLEGNALPEVINGALWTIPLEVKCYVVLALLGVAGLLRPLWLVLLTTALLFAYAINEPRGESLVAGFDLAIEQRFLVEFGLFFAAGSLLHWVKFDNWRNNLARLAVCVALGAVAYGAGRPLLALWLVLPMAVLTLGNASTPGLRSAGRFGDLSYGIYIYGFPVQQTLIWLLRERVDPYTLLALVLLATGALAFASWHLVEKRALRLKPRRPREPVPAKLAPT